MTISIALILGAPETVPAGKIDRKASNLAHRYEIHQYPHDEHYMRSSDPPRLVLSKDSTDLTGQVDDMTELFHPHKVIHLNSLWLADSVDIVPRQVNQHDMLCPVLFAG